MVKNRNCLRAWVAGKLATALPDELGDARLLSPNFGSLLCCVAMVSLISCSGHIAQPDDAQAASTDAGNPTLEPAPKEAIYSFDKAYRKRYGDEVVDPEGEGGDDQ